MHDPDIIPSESYVDTTQKSISLLSQCSSFMIFEIRFHTKYVLLLKYFIIKSEFENNSRFTTTQFYRKLIEISLSKVKVLNIKKTFGLFFGDIAKKEV